MYGAAAFSKPATRTYTLRVEGASATAEEREPEHTRSASSFETTQSHARADVGHPLPTNSRLSNMGSVHVSRINVPPSCVSAPRSSASRLTWPLGTVLFAGNGSLAHEFRDAHESVHTAPERDASPSHAPVTVDPVHTPLLPLNSPLKGSVS